MAVADAVITRYAKQTAGLSSTPGALTQLCTVGNPQPKAMQGKLARDLRCGDLQATAGLPGPKDTGLTLKTEAYGAYTPGASGVAAVAPVSLVALLESLFGAAGVIATGDTVASAAGTTLTTSGTELADNDFVLLAGADSGKNQVRQITSGGGTVNPILNRTLTDDDNTTEVAAAGVVYGGVHWDLTNSNADRNTLFFDIEGDVNKDELFGMTAVGLNINVPFGELATFDWTLDGNNWNRDNTLENPAQVTENNGVPAVAIDSPVWIGDTMYLYRDLSVNIALKYTRVSTPHGVNGYEGIKVTGADVTFSGFIYLGGGNLEAPASLRDTLNLATTQDVLIQIGRTPGATVALRIPAASFKDVSVAEQDGLDGLKFDAMATRTTSEGTSPCRIATL